MNKIICTICHSENFILDLRCSSCGSLIRENIRGINFGEAFSNLLFNPEFEIKRILFSEHKNYIIFLLILFVIKLTIISLYSLAILDHGLSISIVKLILYSLLYWLVYIFLLAVLFNFLIGVIIKHQPHFKNVLSLIAYSFMHFSIFGFLIFILELMLFGMYFFSRNPGIFQIDFYKALTVVGIELILILYSFYLFVKFLVFILQKKFAAIFLSFTFFVSLIMGNEILKTFIGD